ncbi:MAG: hypothetical protein LBE24_07720 [Methylobacillus sp.]|nr:hypothetical protein [Methylobacillus sp.]
MKLFRNTIAFVLIYLLLMIPTYILPWLGSNSMVLNTVGTAMGSGPTPMWWTHAWFLAVLILIGWVRGRFIGKSWLALFPFLAAIFDIVPLLNMIPLVSTVMHLTAIIIGATGKIDAESEVKAPKTAWWLFILISIVALAGTSWFVYSARLHAQTMENGTVWPAPSEKSSSPESVVTEQPEVEPSATDNSEPAPEVEDAPDSEAAPPVVEAPQQDEPAASTETKKPAAAEKTQKKNSASSNTKTDADKSNAPAEKKSTSPVAAPQPAQEQQAQAGSADTQPEEEKKKHGGFRGWFEDLTGVDPGGDASNHECTPSEKSLHVNGC